MKKFLRTLILIVGVGLLVLAGSPPAHTHPVPARIVPLPCDRPLAFYANAGARTVAVYFVLGQQPVVVGIGPTPGARLEGRFVDQAGPYHWWVVWDAQDPAPLWGWSPGQAAVP